MDYEPIYRELSEEDKKDKMLIKECIETLEELIRKINMDLIKLKRELKK